MRELGGKRKEEGRGDEEEVWQRGSDGYGRRGEPLTLFF